jgi:hypothetical protein
MIATANAARGINIEDIFVCMCLLGKKINNKNKS